MKKPISLLLVISLIIGIFVGCTEISKSSSTDSVVNTITIEPIKNPEDVIIGQRECYLDDNYDNEPSIVLTFYQDGVVDFNDTYTADYTFKDGVLMWSNNDLDITMVYVYTFEDNNKLYLVDIFDEDAQEYKFIRKDI